MTTPPQVVCANCQHADKNSSRTYNWPCNALPAMIISYSPITGKPSTKRHRCSDLNTNGDCVLFKENVTWVTQFLANFKHTA